MFLGVQIENINNYFPKVQVNVYLLVMLDLKRDQDGRNPCFAGPTQWSVSLSSWSLKMGALLLIDTISRQANDSREPRTL